MCPGSTASVMSVRSVGKVILNAGFRSCPATRGQYLTELHLQQRLNWCLRNWDYVAQYLNRLLFTDESYFEMPDRKTRKRVRKRPVEAPQQDTVQPYIQKGGGSTSVWRSISMAGAGSCKVYSCRVNKETNAEQLASEF